MTSSVTKHVAPAAVRLVAVRTLDWNFGVAPVLDGLHLGGMLLGTRYSNVPRNRGWDRNSMKALSIKITSAHLYSGSVVGPRGET